MEIILQQNVWVKYAA